MCSIDPDEMQHYAAFHQGLHCLQKYRFRGGGERGLQYKGLNKQCSGVNFGIYSICSHRPLIKSVYQKK